MKHWHSPAGPANSHTREWIQYRLDVRTAAARWCDSPVVDHQEPECTMETACDDCAACEAIAMISEGLA